MASQYRRTARARERLMRRGDEGTWQRLFTQEQLNGWEWLGLGLGVYKFGGWDKELQK
jgi:hypothetical protein